MHISNNTIIITDTKSSDDPIKSWKILFDKEPDPLNGSTSAPSVEIEVLEIDDQVDGAEAADSAAWVLDTYWKWHAQITKREIASLLIIVSVEGNFQPIGLSCMDSEGHDNTYKFLAPVLAMLALTFPEAFWFFHHTGKLPKPFLPHELNAGAKLWSGQSSLPGIAVLLQNGWTNLFDVTGLTRTILYNTHHALTENGSEALPTPRWHPWGVAIDEEEEYAYFHAYALTRWRSVCTPGSEQADEWGALPVTRRRLYDILFADSFVLPMVKIGSAEEYDPARTLLDRTELISLEQGYSPLRFSIEDRNLEFADNPQMGVPQRSDFERLNNITEYFFVTGGDVPKHLEKILDGQIVHKPTQGLRAVICKIQTVLEQRCDEIAESCKKCDKELRAISRHKDEKERHFREAKNTLKTSKEEQSGTSSHSPDQSAHVEEPQHIKEQQLVVLRLQATVDELVGKEKAKQEEIKQLRQHHEKLKQTLDEIRKSKTAVPTSPELSVLPQKRTEHSAPGRLLVVAQALRDRASRILSEAKTVREAITAARLAHLGEQVLGKRTPTLALEILALRQRAEVKAEGMFYGVNPDPDSTERAAEIIRATDAIGQNFGEANRRASIYSAQVNIIEEIVTAYREQNQFDAEINFLNKSREIRGKRTIEGLIQRSRKNRIPLFEVYDLVITFALLLCFVSYFKVVYFPGKAQNASWVQNDVSVTIIMGIGALSGLVLVCILYWCFSAYLNREISSKKTPTFGKGFWIRRLWYWYRDFTMRDLKNLVAAQLVIFFLSTLFYLNFYPPTYKASYKHSNNVQAGPTLSKDAVDENTLSYNGVLNIALIRAQIEHEWREKISHDVVHQDKDVIDESILRITDFVGSALYDTTTALVGGQSPIDYKHLVEGVPATGDDAVDYENISSRPQRLLGPFLGSLIFVVGVLQTGLFLSYLYTRLSRR